MYEKAHGPFFHEFEAFDDDRRTVFWRKRLADLVAHSRAKAPFYGERLGGYDAGAEHPLSNVPTMGASDLRTAVPPGGRSLLTSESTGFTVFQSGGTTGVPKTTLFTHTELEEINQLNGRGFYATGLLPSDRVGNFWAVGGLYMTFIHMNRMLQQYGNMNFPFSNHTPSDFVYNVANLFKINCFSGIASVVLNTLREIEAQGHHLATGFGVEKVYYGGEHLYEADRKELREKFGVKTILAPGYGTVDTWYIGYQCTETPAGVFHAHEDQCYSEIFNEDETRHCNLGEVGMLYATPLVRFLTPVIRYRVGDKARWLGGECACGRKTRRFELLGRGDDVLRIGYDSVDYNGVQEVALKIPGLSGSIQMEKRREEGKDRLVIRIESPAPAENFAGLAENFEQEFLSLRPSFREFVKKGSVWPLAVDILPLGTLERNSRTGKLIRVKDVV